MEEKRSDTVNIIGGTGVSAGIAIGYAHLVARAAIARSGQRLLSDFDVAEALASFDAAVTASVNEVETIGLKAGRSLSVEEQAIADTQVEFLTDPQLRENVLEKITGGRMAAPDAVLETIAELVTQFSQMEDEYLRARAADIDDIGQRIVRHLVATGNAEPKKPAVGSILIAGDISPSEAIALDLSAIAGFATRSGGKTSHTALLARARKIPAVVGCGALLDSVKQDDLLIVDGTTGEIIINPETPVLAEYSRRREQELSRSVALSGRGRNAAKTKDGTEVRLLLNISGPGDLDSAESQQADGIGLYRTEMLFMRGDRFPTESEQLDEYRQVMKKAGSRPVIFRTVDIGGDKPLPYFPFPEEQNPFLGYRAIRFSLDRKDIFLVQLRAVLRATAGGNAGIMFPMISSLQECRAALAMLKKAVTELRKEGLAFNENLKTGIMIEIPAAAIMADRLATEVDFFSIGTNDLCQYTLAVDRMNEKIKELYNPFHPGLIRLIRTVIEAGHRNGISVGLCGEMAGDPEAALLLLGMGLREFSMSAPSIPEISEIICACSEAEAQRVAASVLEMGDAGEIRDYLKTNRS